MDFKEYRPERYLHKNEEKLLTLTNELKIFIKETYSLFYYNSLQLNDEKLEKIAHLLIEFAEDINLEIGIWKTYENYNINTFETPLPCTMEKGKQIPVNDVFNEYRIQHFLWNIYGMVEPDLKFSPFHQDLLILSREVASFLNNAKSKFPKYSTIKRFLKQPDNDAYDVKRKLIWLGTKSYFFRECFNFYLRKEDLKEEISIIDDFINQVATLWSGIGVINILPDLLVIPKSRKIDIKKWYERHLAFYYVKLIRGSKLITTNIINESTYRIVNGSKNSPFKVGDIIFGSTVKYGDDWYWSGAQRHLGNLSENQINEIREDFVKNSSRIVYRYDKKLLELAKSRTKEFYNEFVSEYGDEIMEFNDGLSYVASLQKREREKYEELSEEEFEEFKVKHKLKNKSPNFNIPEKITNCENGIAVFFNINEGQEILIDFNNFKKAFVKQGENLTEEDFDYIYAMIEDNSISPGFVKKIIKLYGTKSILKAYCIDNEECIEYLMYKYKGLFYKQRYPSLTIN